MRRGFFRQSRVSSHELRFLDFFDVQLIIRLLSSYFAEGNHRVHFRRTSCWEIASQRGHGK